ncbi:MAG: response regulator transcription factor [Anaerolinea sp.]|nr:response regulator transcription factor [Anaerolinea sp.]
MAEKVNVALIDDHPVFMEGLALLLSQTGDIQVVGTTDNRAGLFSLLDSERVHVVVLDLLMPDPGLSILSEIRRRGINVRVLILSGCEEIHKIRAAIEGGAEGYVFKTQPFRQIIDSIRQVAQGQLVYPLTAQPLFKHPAKKDELSQRELEVLSCIASGLTNSEISEQLVISRNTVGFHIKSIFAKLGVNNRTEATIWYFKNRSSFE